MGIRKRSEKTFNIGRYKTTYFGFKQLNQLDYLVAIYFIILRRSKVKLTVVRFQIGNNNS
uniref:Uncharacterized protein n=1 Tax=Octopus bimaculoides TaxID=37653 RepID=A0A0L8HK70_OCTBM